MEKIVVGLSGGVDSALSARILKDKGYDVLGVYLDIGLENGIAEAEKVAKETEIAFKVRDIRAELNAKICTPFVESYLHGETPCPCVDCNAAVKFPILLEEADIFGAKKVATGHYALKTYENGRYCLLKSNNSKDQSYMLGMLTQDMLARIEFPIGELEKGETRRIAQIKGISAASKSDSMEICFIPDNDYIAFIESRTGKLKSGDFLDADGNVIGRHEGIHRYTPGQRKGLGGTFGKPMYVKKIDAEKNAVILCEDKDLYAESFFVKGFNYVSYERLEEGKNFGIKVRHSRKEYPVKVRFIEKDFAEVLCAEKVRAPSPGQAAVFYDGDKVAAAGKVV